MHLPPERIAGEAIRVGIGDAAIGSPKDAHRVTLGSCVGVCLVRPKASQYAIAHVLLPNRRDDDVGSPGSRFADTVVGYLMQRLGPDVRARQVVAYIAGGSSMFDAPDGVGAANIAQLTKSLAEHRIRVVGSDMGGHDPRQLIAHGPSRSVISLHLGSDDGHPTWEMPRSFEGSPSLFDKEDQRERA